MSASDGTEEFGCLEDSFPSDQEQAVLTLYLNAFDEWPTEFPGFAMTTRRTDGEWYISPIGTTFDGYIDLLGSFEEDQLDEFVTSVEDFYAMDAINDAIDEAVGSGAITEEAFDAIDDEAMFDDSFDDTFDDTFEPIESVDPVQESTIQLDIERGATGELDDSIEAGAYDVAFIDLEAGDTVVVTVQTSPASFLDTTLTMYDESFTEVGFNDDAFGLASGFDSQLEVTVSETGTYTIEIGGASTIRCRHW